MTVTQSFSLSLTYTSLRMYLPQSTPAAAAPASQNTPAATADDSVTLSPQATAPAAADQLPASTQPEESVNGTPASPDVPVSAPPVESSETPGADAPAAPPSRAARRAEALQNALDADQDGTITKEEFVEGAMTLLRRAGARHHYRHHRSHGEGGEGHDNGSHEGQGTSRLERKLDRLFDRVDASGDGSVDQAELTDALAKVTRERAPETPAAPTVTEPQTTPAAGAAMSYTSITVTIAVKQYASVAAMSA